MSKEDERKVTLLLIEQDEDSKRIFERTIKRHFPEFELQIAHHPDAAIELLERQDYDIVICDAFLALNEKIEFAKKLCALEARGTLLLITGHSDFEKETLPPNLCVQSVLHKPLDLRRVVAEIECAAVGVMNRRRTGRPRR